MIPIKFRAWDNFNECYYYSDNYKNLAKFFDFCQQCINAENQLIFEQFTELHDKNGKEIYEGEILYNNDRKEHCIVKYSQEKAMFIVKYLESNDEFPLWQSISNLCYSVGNIYEHRELLENKLAD